MPGSRVRVPPLLSCKTLFDNALSESSDEAFFALLSTVPRAAPNGFVIWPPLLSCALATRCADVEALHQKSQTAVRDTEATMGVNVILRATIALTSGILL